MEDSKPDNRGNVLIDLFDYTGNTAKPYREAGWTVYQVDKQLGSDVLNFRNAHVLLKGPVAVRKVIVIAMIPCTDYALSGAKHFAAKDSDGRTADSNALCDATKNIIDFWEGHGLLQCWMVENPMSRIHKLNPWLGNPSQKLNPCDVAGYDPEPENSRYNKRTWLFGNFQQIPLKRLEPIEKDNPGWKKYGGSSIRTKNARSITPLGLSYGFYEANH
jgi:hypothetical protein